MTILAVTATAWSAVRPANYATWFFELFMGAAGVGILVAMRNRWRFSPVVYWAVAVHFVILAIGAKYTYAEMPLFNWLRDELGWSRNHFDRVGHFLQGVTPALIAREVLLIRTQLASGKLVSLLAVSAALSFSALYELLEWIWVLIFYPSSGPEWLGMQGDPWDAQGDMFMALCGAATALLLFSRFQDRGIESWADGPAH